jgi:hypothetical protein
VTVTGINLGLLMSALATPQLGTFLYNVSAWDAERISSSPAKGKSGLFQNS